MKCEICEQEKHCVSIDVEWTLLDWACEECWEKECDEYYGYTNNSKGEMLNMRLFLLKRDHHEGQSIYGVFESEELAKQQIKTLREEMKNVPESHYIIKELSLNELTEIEAYE